MCGHGDERVICDSKGNKVCKVDGYEPTTRTLYQYHGCRWHGCHCQGEGRNVKRYEKTLEIEEFIKSRGYDVVFVWECEKPPMKRRFFEPEFVPYPHYIVFDFEALLKVLNECRTSDLTYTLEQTVVSLAVHDTLGGEPSFLLHKDPKELIRLFVEELKRRQKLIVENVKDVYPYPLDFVMLPCAVLNEWGRWVNQVPVIGFNSGKYDLNLIKRYFVDKIAKADGDTDPKIFVARKENNYMFLTTDEFKFLDIKNFLAPGMSYDVWCKSVDCNLQKLTFPYEWLTSYEKLNHVGPVKSSGFLQ